MHHPIINEMLGHVSFLFAYMLTIYISKKTHLRYEAMQFLHLQKNTTYLGGKPYGSDRNNRGSTRWFMSPILHKGRIQATYVGVK